MTNGWRYAMSILLILWATHAKCEDPKEWIVENAPESYIVKKADTLWDVASKFLHDPWRWQQILKVNSDEKDSKLIYPGDRITLSYHEGRPQLEIRRAQASLSSQEESQARVIKLYPHVRILAADRAIPTIPLKIIEPFLTHSRVVTAEQVKGSPQVIALAEDHLIVGTSDRIFVKGLPPKTTDQIFTLYRADKNYRDPKTQELLGIEALVLGKAQLEKRGRDTQPDTMLIEQSFSEVKVGDKLLSTFEEEVDPYFFPKIPDKLGEGQIISVFGGLSQIGQYQVVVITGGQNQHREIGDVLGIYQNQKDLPLRFVRGNDKHEYDFPSVRVGFGMIFHIFEKVSYMLVMSAVQPIYLLDEVHRP